VLRYFIVSFWLTWLIFGMLGRMFLLLRHYGEKFCWGSEAREARRQRRRMRRVERCAPEADISLTAVEERETSAVKDDMRDLEELRGRKLSYRNLRRVGNSSKAISNDAGGAICKLKPGGRDSEETISRKPTFYRELTDLSKHFKPRFQTA
jgi:hypothetical protein